jgi:hypothetical protein
MPLGYEPYDDRLCRLGQSLVTVMISEDLQRHVVSDIPRLPISV